MELRCLAVVRCAAGACMSGGLTGEAPRDYEVGFLLESMMQFRRTHVPLMHSWMLFF